MWKYNSPEELYHWGILGMHWGRRIIRGHAGPGIYINKKRRLAGDKRDLNALNNGQHLSVGITKKRQDAYDARDKAAIQKRIDRTIYKNKKRSIRGDINNEARRLKDESSFMERVMYNNATRRKAGKLIVERNMDRNEAISKAKKIAWRNTGLIFIATIGASSILKKLKR